MASRVIHYIVGLQIAERVELKTPERFFFGNILPDCVDSPGGRKKGGPKAKSHFWDIREKEHIKGQNWHWFWDKYARHREDELYLGYMCHLVTDAVWVRDVIVPIKDNKQLQEWTLEALYRDYHRLNELLREEFHPALPEMNWIENEIEEVDPSVWDWYWQALLDELEENTGAKKEDLERLAYDQLLTFIDKAAAVASEEICAKRENRIGLDPVSLYVRKRLGLPR